MKHFGQFFVNLALWGNPQSGWISKVPKIVRAVISMILLWLMAIKLLTCGEANAQTPDLGFDPTAPQGADFAGFKSTVTTIDGQTAIKTTMSLVCVQGVAVLDTAGLTFNADNSYFETPALMTMSLRDLSGTVITDQVFDYWHISNSSGINYAEPLRVADTIAWMGWTDPNLPPDDGTTLAPQISAGYQNGFWGANEDIPVYLVIPSGFSSGIYEFCCDADFSYFVNESTDPNEFPDSWCFAVQIDIITGTVDKVAYPQPPTPPTSVDATYQAGQPVDVVFDGDPSGTYEVERWTKKGGTTDNNGGRNKKLNSMTVQGNQFTDPDIESDSEMFWSTRNKVHFYYKINGVQSNINEL